MLDVLPFLNCVLWQTLVRQDRLPVMILLHKLWTLNNVDVDMVNMFGHLVLKCKHGEHLSIASRVDQIISLVYVISAINILSKCIGSYG